MLLLQAILLQCAFFAMLLLRDWNSSIPLFLTIYFVAFAAFYWAAVRVNRNAIDSTRATKVIVAAAVVFRLTVIWCPPTLSEDFYRYVWDGRVQRAGIGPYEYPPEAQELKHLRDSDYEKINYKRFKTPYPPFAEAFFYLLALISATPAFFKFVFLLFDIFLIEIIRRLLILEKRSPALLLIYAWHPLVIIEFSASAHMDVVGLCLMMLSIWLAQRNAGLLSGICIAAACLTKYLPAVVIPWLFRNGGWKFALGVILSAAGILALYYDPDFSLLGGISVYYRKWRFNDSLFGIFYNALGGAEPARRFGAAISIAVLLFCYLQKVSVYRAALLTIGTLLLVSPVVHPWYICWIIPFLAFHSNRAWLFFSGWIAVSYLIRHMYPEGLWKPVPWLKMLVYAPFFAIWVFDFVKSRINLRASRVRTIAND